MYNKYKERRGCMSKVLFTDSEVKKLRKNKYVRNVSNKSITYTDEFKENH